MVIEKPEILVSKYVYVKDEGGYGIIDDAPNEDKIKFKEFEETLKVAKG